MCVSESDRERAGDAVVQLRRKNLEDADRHVAAQPRLPLEEEGAGLLDAQRVRAPVVQPERAEVLPETLRLCLSRDVTTHEGG